MGVERSQNPDSTRSDLSADEKLRKDAREMFSRVPKFTKDFTFEVVTSNRTTWGNV